MVLGQAVACSRAPSNMNNPKADKIPVGELWTAALRPQFRRSTRSARGPHVAVRRHPMTWAHPSTGPVKSRTICIAPQEALPKWVCAKRGKGNDLVDRSGLISAQAAARAVVCPLKSGPP